MKHEESDLQRTCVKWFSIAHPTQLLISIPNGSVLRGSPIERAKQWRRLEAEGAYSGAADLFLVAAGKLGHGLFSEMKSRTGSQSPNQRKFETLAKSKGYGYVTCRSLDEFMYNVSVHLAH